MRENKPRPAADDQRFSFFRDRELLQDCQDGSRLELNFREGGSKRWDRLPVLDRAANVLSADRRGELVQQDRIGTEAYDRDDFFPGRGGFFRRRVNGRDADAAADSDNRGRGIDRESVPQNRRDVDFIARLKRAEPFRAFPDDGVDKPDIEDRKSVV